MTLTLIHKTMGERTTVDSKVIEHLHCICNLIANFFGYEFHVSVKLDRTKKYTMNIEEIPEYPVLIEKVLDYTDKELIASAM